MAYDANLILQATTTQTASFNSAGINLLNSSLTTGTNLGGTPSRGMKARVIVTAASGTTPTAVFSIQHSDDNATWVTIASQLDPPLAGVGQTFINFETSKPWIRLVSTIAGTTPSYTYHSELGMSRP